MLEIIALISRGGFNISIMTMCNTKTYNFNFIIIFISLPLSSLLLCVERENSIIDFCGILFPPFMVKFSTLCAEHNWEEENFFFLSFAKPQMFGFLCAIDMIHSPHNVVSDNKNVYFRTTRERGLERLLPQQPQPATGLIHPNSSQLNYQRVHKKII